MMFSPRSLASSSWTAMGRTRKRATMQLRARKQEMEGPHSSSPRTNREASSVVWAATRTYSTRSRVWTSWASSSNRTHCETRWWGSSTVSSSRTSWRTWGSPRTSKRTTRASSTWVPCSWAIRSARQDLLQELLWATSTTSPRMTRSPRRNSRSKLQSTCLKSIRWNKCPRVMTLTRGRPTISYWALRPSRKVVAHNSRTKAFNLYPSASRPKTSRSTDSLKVKTWSSSLAITRAGRCQTTLALYRRSIPRLAPQDCQHRQLTSRPNLSPTSFWTSELISEHRAALSGKATNEPDNLKKKAAECFFGPLNVYQDWF